MKASSPKAPCDAELAPDLERASTHENSGGHGYDVWRIGGRRFVLLEEADEAVRRARDTAQPVRLLPDEEKAQPVRPDASPNDLLALARFRILDKRNGTEEAKDKLLGVMADEIEALRAERQPVAESDLDTEHGVMQRLKELFGGAANTAHLIRAMHKLADGALGPSHGAAILTQRECYAIGREIGRLNRKTRKEES